MLSPITYIERTLVRDVFLSFQYEQEEGLQQEKPWQDLKDTMKTNVFIVDSLYAAWTVRLHKVVQCCQLGPVAVCPHHPVFPHLPVTSTVHYFKKGLMLCIMSYCCLINEIPISLHLSPLERGKKRGRDNEEPC